jgi:hypothetical protein
VLQDGTFEAMPAYWHCFGLINLEAREDHSRMNPCCSAPEASRTPIGEVFYQSTHPLLDRHSSKFPHSFPPTPVTANRKVFHSKKAWYP